MIGAEAAGPEALGDRAQAQPRSETGEGFSQETICTSIVVAAELRFGAEKSASRPLADRIDLILSALDVLPLESPANRHYGRIRQHLARQGTPIGPMTC